MNAPIYTARTANDAGLLRQYLAQRFGQYIAGNGRLPHATARFVERSIARLAKMAGTTVEQIAADLKADAEALYGEAA